MTIKDRYTRTELTRPQGQHWFVCALCCRGASTPTDVVHQSLCPLSDDTVMAITIAVSPQANATICGRCNVAAQECPAYAQLVAVFFIYYFIKELVT